MTTRELDGQCKQIRPPRVARKHGRALLLGCHGNSPSSPLLLLALLPLISFPGAVTRGLCRASLATANLVVMATYVYLFLSSAKRAPIRVKQ